MSLLPANYINVVNELKDKIRGARQRAILSVNKELNLVYWEIGNIINRLQKEQGWGAKVIERLSVDLKTEFPDFKGLSLRNLKYMSLLARRFPQFGQQPAAQLLDTENQVDKIGQQLAAQLPWGHLQVLMDKVEGNEETSFYIQKCIENGWSRNILTEQITSKLFFRQGNAITNFTERLPSLQSDLAQQTFKNPYLFDFISLGEEIKERDLENALIHHLKSFMLELGRGFAYVGRQKNLVVQGDDFFLDLLFYNYNMHCFVVFELKVGDFKPEYAGKLNFYVNAINEQIKGANDKPTIGVLLCKTPNETVVRYSLKGIESPIGVADYQLAQALPKQLQLEMPTVEELEEEIDKEYEELKSPSERKWDTLKQKLATLNQPKVEVPVTHERLCQIFDQSLRPLFEKLLEKLKVFHSEFMSFNFFWSGPNNITELEVAANAWKDETFLKQNREAYFFYRLNGLKALGIDTFDIVIQLNYLFHHPYWWGFSIPNFNNNQPFFRKLYNEQLSKEEHEQIWNIIHGYIVDEIERRVSYLQQDKTRNV
jgi:predicted nuclease of restriction endonuclease-like (RecB) superfamily